MPRTNELSQDEGLLGGEEAWMECFETLSDAGTLPAGEDNYTSRYIYLRPLHTGHGDSAVSPELKTDAETASVKPHPQHEAEPSESAASA